MICVRVDKIDFNLVITVFKLIPIEYLEIYDWIASQISHKLFDNYIVLNKSLKL